MYGNSGTKRIGLPGLSPQLVDKQHQMEATDQELENARAKYEQWKINSQSKRLEIEKKQQDLAEQKKILDAFTQHHIQEIEKARKRENEENEQSKSIMQELKKLSEEEEKLRTKNDSLKAELQSLQPCADYLQSVVDSCQSFDSIESILNRYDSLSSTRAEFLQKYQNLMATYGADESNLTKQLETKRLDLINKTMRYNEGITKISQMRKMSEYEKATLIKDIQRIEDKNTEIAAIKTSIKAIFGRALQHSSGAFAQQLRKKGDVPLEQMLEYIENRFNDLKSIINDKDVVYVANANPQPQHQPQSYIRKSSNSML
ncbi:DnaJ domain containing protein [Histomonas meleagridis]|uniref:DnaJ domain containing protein n=1 Tax=Histomonas meleagridis TaxID=135588 RepID=UPI00355A14CF|nr:DnaJ domain containing protein [Histomonas meleagridis]KAH0796880.1 DnaJ domain containing protein [Histomonas meleagridis]